MLGTEPLRLLNPQRLENSLSRDPNKKPSGTWQTAHRESSDIADARHRQQEPFRPSIERYLQRLRKVLNGHDAAAETHVPKNNKLRLHRLAEHPEQNATKAANVIVLVGPVLCNSTRCRW